MKDRKANDTAPLAPRRPLTGPPQAPGAHQGAARPPVAPPPPADVGANGAGGPPTASMQRISAAPQTAPPDQRHGPGPQAPMQPRGASTVGAAPQATPTTAPEGPARPRRARLRIVRVDPWSVMKFAFAMSIALAIITVVAVAIVWAVLGAAGVWDSINSSVATVLSDTDATFDVTDYVGLGRVLGLTMIVAVADVILITAIATLGAFLYNLAAALLGGLEVTLAENR